MRSGGEQGAADYCFSSWLLRKVPGFVRAGRDHPAVAQNFIGCDREQVLLLPPSLREWLPEGHLAWFVLAAVEQMDLSGF
jgi:hypothetical protein